ncbi:NAD(P)/FAD-dependent oxidoreductase [Methylocystis sp. B8]|uniref:NAD(P)/FAD-dependent oxidoreductase n=1 Tax=Methylocystis sp. B8 TaxID=544938 RepID=UPI0010FE0987|nr:NAD(P)/FAD-dependent oxidoreductase [Methylocystis sp. B8]TLG78906.1 NAD(P)/FAD-dependent oxidoreductase [Methylocystis sp. B8]
MQQSSAAESQPRIVIIGGGFAGIAAAQALAGADARVLILDSNNHHCFQPLLYQVATAALAAPEVAWPIRHVVRRQRSTTVLMLTVEGVDTARKVVKTRKCEIGYDFLVVATGATHSYFGHDWAKLAPGLKTISDAALIRRRLLLAFERAEVSVDPVERERLLTIIIVGGGPTGVELAGAIAELARHTLPPEFRRANPKNARIILLEAGPRILSSFPERLSEYARKSLERNGVEVRTALTVDQVFEDRIIAGETEIAAGVILWAAGVRASPAANWLGVEGDHAGRIAVNENLTVPCLPNVYVIGDLAFLTGPDGTPVPALAASAKQMGKYVGNAIRLRLLGRSPSKPFRYRDYGNLATIGRNSAIVKLGRLELTGFPGWLFWSIVHIYFLVNLRSRIFVAMSWIATYLTSNRGARIITR